MIHIPFIVLKNISEYLTRGSLFVFSLCSRKFNKIFNDSQPIKILNHIIETNQNAKYESCVEHYKKYYPDNDKIIEIFSKENKKITIAESTLKQFEIFKLLLNSRKIKFLLISFNSLSLIIKYFESYKLIVRNENIVLDKFNDIFRFVNKTQLNEIKIFSCTYFMYDLHQIINKLII